MFAPQCGDSGRARGVPRAGDIPGVSTGAVPCAEGVMETSASPASPLSMLTLPVLVVLVGCRGFTELSPR